MDQFLYLDGADGYTSPWAETAHKFAKLEKSVKCCGFTNANLCERWCQVTEGVGVQEGDVSSPPQRWGGEGDQDGCCHISATGNVLGGSVLKRRKIKVTTGQSVLGLIPRLKLPTCLQQQLDHQVTVC